MAKKENIPTATIKRVTPLSPFDDFESCCIRRCVVGAESSAVATADDSKGEWEYVNMKLEYSDCRVRWIIARNSVET